MLKHFSVVCALALFAAGAAWAHNCPNEMKAIDAKLSTKPALSKDVARQSHQTARRRRDSPQGGQARPNR